MSLLDISRLASVIGILFSVAWALFIFRRTMIEKSGSEIRTMILKVLIEVQSALEYQKKAMAITRDLFDTDSNHNIMMIEEIINNRDKTTVSDWVLDHYSASSILFPIDATRSSLEHIRPKLPVYYDFVNKIIKMNQLLFESKIHPNNLTEMLTKSIEMINTEERDIQSKQEIFNVIIQWKNISRIVVTTWELNGSSVQDIASKCERAIAKYSEFYLRSSDEDLRSFHREEMNYYSKIKQCNTITDGTIEIVKWRIGKKDPELLADLVTDFTELKGILKKP